MCLFVSLPSAGCYVSLFFCVCVLRMRSGSHAWIIHFQGCMHQCRESALRGRLLLRGDRETLLEDGSWARTHTVEWTQWRRSQRPALRSLHQPEGTQTNMSGIKLQLTPTVFLLQMLRVCACVLRILNMYSCMCVCVCLETSTNYITKLQQQSNNKNAVRNMRDTVCLSPHKGISRMPEVITHACILFIDTLKV